MPFAPFPKGISKRHILSKDYRTSSILRQEYPVQLEADAQVTNGVIVGIFDLLRKNGFASVNLRTVER